jgi:hypothetical protein
MISKTPKPQVKKIIVFIKNYGILKLPNLPRGRDEDFHENP